MSCDDIYILFWNTPKSKNFVFGSIFVLKLITCFFKCPTFPFPESDTKNREFQKFAYYFPYIINGIELLHGNKRLFKINDKKIWIHFSHFRFQNWWLKRGCIFKKTESFLQVAAAGIYYGGATQNKWFMFHRKYGISY